MNLVYHYTSLEAATSILRSKKLRFIDCEYQADKAELAYCYKVYSEAWHRELRRRGALEVDIAEHVTALAYPYEDDYDLGEPCAFPARFYLFCATDTPDSDLMWRAYACREGRAGCVLALDVDLLEHELGIGFKDVAGAAYHEAVCDSVIYGRDGSLSLLQDAISAYVDNMAVAASMRDLVQRVGEMEGARGEHWHAVARLAPFMKRSQYRGERERRFVLRVPEAPELEEKVFACPGYPLSERRFLLSKGCRCLIPYREWDFASCAKKLVHAVYLSPETEGQGRALRSLKWFLENEGYELTEALAACNGLGADG